MTEQLYIHPHSALYNTDPTADLPEFVVYGPLLTNDKGDTTYMTCVSVISAKWLNALSRDCPLLQVCMYA